MSRVAKQPVELPKGVEVSLSAQEISVKGPLGSLKQALCQNVKVSKDGEALKIEAANETIEANALSGTMRALIANMVHGVSKGFEKKLTLVGVGYKAQAQGDKLNLSLGFSHPVEHKMPAGI
jgi:large subunit ribosomal protein L6